MIDQSAGALSAFHGRDEATKPGSNLGDKAASQWSKDLLQHTSGPKTEVLACAESWAM